MCGHIGSKKTPASRTPQCPIVNSKCVCVFFHLQVSYGSMLSAAHVGARTPLSPLTQTTLEKHLPGLPKRRFLQQQQSQVQRCDVGCITGMCVFFIFVKLPNCSSFRNFACAHLARALWRLRNRTRLVSFRALAITNNADMNEKNVRGSIQNKVILGNAPCAFHFECPPVSM